MGDPDGDELVHRVTACALEAHAAMVRGREACAAGRTMIAAIEFHRHSELILMHARLLHRSRTK